MIRAAVASTVVTIGLVAGIGPAAVSAAPPAARVIAVSYVQGAAFVNVVVAIPNGIENAATNGNADFGLHITLTYVDSNGTVDTLDVVRSVRDDAVLLGSLDNHTDEVQLTLQFGALTDPGNTPSFSPTAELLYPASG